jgi:hypothetical protein
MEKSVPVTSSITVGVDDLQHGECHRATDEGGLLMRCVSYGVSRSAAMLALLVFGYNPTKVQNRS